MKKLLFSEHISSIHDAHIAGGCLLPEIVEWPIDEDGNSQLHLVTLPLCWLMKEASGWVSIFTPYSLSDTYQHWETLTMSDRNRSVAIIHDNNGPPRDEYQKKFSIERQIHLIEDLEVDTEENFKSKIHGVPAWLQDQEILPDHTCVLAISGNDIDIGFPEEPGIFSDGMVYLFLRNGFESCQRPSAQGLISFQFT